MQKEQGFAIMTKEMRINGYRSMPIKNYLCYVET